MICTRGCGRRNWSNPRTRSRGSVVAANRTASVAESSTLSSSTSPPRSPSTARLTGPTSTRSPVATIGRTSAARRNGSTGHSRRSTYDGGTWLSATRALTMTAYPAKASR